MTTSARLGLPLLDAAQAQKHVTHNEALADLDALVHLAVLARDVASPPGAPAAGDRVLVGAGATGAFAGHAGAVASFDAGGWAFYAPRAGWRVYVQADGAFLIHDGTGWTDVGLLIRSLQNLTGLGVGATSDATNAFVAKLNAALFTARAATESGTGDLRLTLNKSATANTGSLLYQTAYGGRAELGLSGDDVFRVKVSADGATWRTGVSVDPATGVASFPSGLSGAAQVAANGGATNDLAHWFAALDPSASGFQSLFTALFKAWAAGLPVYSGSGAAPVARGEPFNNGGVVMIAQ